MAEALLPLESVAGLVFSFCRCLIEILKYGVNVSTKLWCGKSSNYCLSDLLEETNMPDIS